MRFMTDVLSVTGSQSAPHAAGPASVEQCPHVIGSEAIVIAGNGVLQAARWPPAPIDVVVNWPALLGGLGNRAKAIFGPISPGSQPLLTV